MSAISKIQWCDRTWNPVRGCSIVSPGCHSCYAMKQAHRFSGPGRAYEGLTKQTKAGPQWTGVTRLGNERTLMEPYRWKTPCRIFVNSMSDLFHESLTNEQIADVFHVMYGEASTVPAPLHTFQVLTKRPERMADWFTWLLCYEGDDPTILALHVNLRMRGAHSRVWLGVSVEDRPRLSRIDVLRRLPAAVKFLSVEPLLEDLGDLDLTEIDWVIVGGESGPRARPCDLRWIRSIVEQCREAGVACFVKQLGSAPLDWSQAEPTGHFRTSPETGARQVQVTQPKLRDRKGGDPSEWPDDLRIREFPGVVS